MDIALLTETKRARKDHWYTDECPPGCHYQARCEEHVHERHDDGSRAVLGPDASGLWSLLEFQGTLW